ncbi:carboxylesterase 1F [Phlebotomus argentipes]|uniref:carboxylesterase 1F n=1 Tax=Phlebotomus argentipes TaxID=94469 RepID=UPI00289361AF|nr:carboxylesterase 1F [Phlebotomus argentipes]
MIEISGIFALLLIPWAAAQYTTVVLSQGTLVGIKVFPESSRVPVYAFLGIPYAKPPADELRFAPPAPHPGWNGTLLARDFQPICPQLERSPLEEVSDYNPLASATSEDCLFLNVWTPETGFRYGNIPVVVIITGEDHAFDYLRHRPTGLDLASEGIVVVSVQYRTNIFGWLSLQHELAPGNLGLLDQNLALLWVQRNIHQFGGDPKRITLLGHGNTGAANAMIHLTSSKSRDLFSRLIVMSGTIFSSYSYQLQDPERLDLTPSEQIVQILACDSTEIRYILTCLRRKSVGDLLRAFEMIYQMGNYTKLLGPVLDRRFHMDDSRKLIASGTYLMDIPILTGICNNEGAFLRDSWIEFGKQGSRQLKKFIDDTIIPNILEHYAFDSSGQGQIRETIDWRFFDQTPKTNSVPYLIDALQKLVSETKYETPFFETIELISGGIVAKNYSGKSVRKKSNLFVYSFQQPYSIDMRGRVNYFGGASHTSDLPFLLGPSLLQQIGRRRLSQSEDKLCKKLRQFFGDFIKSGNPTPGRLFDAWKPYTRDAKYIKVLSSKADTLALQDDLSQSGVEKNIVMIEHIFSNSRPDVSSVPQNPYQLSTNLPSGRAVTTRGQSDEYINDIVNLQYFSELSKVHSFWSKLLPRIHQNAHLSDQLLNGRQDMSGIQFFESASSSKYKHAFFSMLTLVCLLLTVLCVCVYILKRNTRNFGRRFKRSTQATKTEDAAQSPAAEAPAPSQPTNLDAESYALDESIEVRNWRYHLTNNRF